MVARERPISTDNMKILKVRIIANKLDWATWPAHISKLKKWFLPKIDMVFDLVHTDFDEVPFIQYTSNMLGVDHVWYDANITPMGKGYDIILFVLSPEQWRGNGARGWRTDRDQGPVQLQIAAGEFEKLYLPDPPRVNRETTTFFEYARHEIMHALFMITGQFDTTHYWYEQDPEKLINALNELVFPETRTPEEPTTKTQDFVTAALGWVSQVIQWLNGGMIGSVPQLPPSIMPETQQTTEKVPMLNTFCLAIQEMEGYYPPGTKGFPNGSKSWRNKNPGNIRYIGQKRAVDQDAQKFCIFKTYEDGFLTLKEMIQRAATGASKVYRPEMTFTDFFKVYAPSSDGNYPEKYAKFVAEKCGVSVFTRIKELI